MIRQLQVAFGLFICCAFLLHVALCIPPGQVVNINNWYLTLPIGSYKNPQNIYQPNLNTFESDPYFVTGNDGNSIRFRVPIHKQTVTTSGSSYPRTELREMDSSNPSKTKVAWTNSDKGVHTMIIDQAITHLPIKRNRLAAGQIHDDNEFVIIIQLTGSQLFVKTNKNANAKVLDSNYQLGTRFLLKIEGFGGITNIYYNDMTKAAYSYEYSYKNAYFKAGCYSQSNCDYEQELCTDTSFVEIVYGNI
ncbi:predicted protein [Naegleria gruberi]|uniref:Predicted protein n=1 Tax=Naegleria gruberi TaxID=5762 RepID=D2VSF2_NAEGR|nr:uncharacterized protein NAEGRDRAFT_71919 [Naegleria gruberi]EFC40109.1 predicted protein [Naegleria gruberi]|eukprot:XP_002672853.1 predicted protein [Naegleria gruberi strain NEG-M]